MVFLHFLVNVVAPRKNKYKLQISFPKLDATLVSVFLYTTFADPTHGNKNCGYIDNNS